MRPTLSLFSAHKLDSSLQSVDELMLLNLAYFFPLLGFPFSFPHSQFHLVNFYSSLKAQFKCHFLHKVSFILSQCSPFPWFFILLLIKCVLVHMHAFLMYSYTRSPYVAVKAVHCTGLGGIIHINNDCIFILKISGRWQ